ncbi:sodium:calcium antiporter [Roseivivax isoporae]|uniref:Cation transporter n=1 Tax=Roseivivax isoporae LMG 25204 TaxID=1449351 RepID=X7F6B6_9RHOB|nr:cation transporter [Roseivivax isoporae]ETX27626.1 cation transporter [Roseivivax isoporae LMG 25204]
MLNNLPLPFLLAIFAVAGAAVVAASIRATGLADAIADRTRMGEAMAGGLILGAATSLSGVVVSVSAAFSGDASYAFSNAVGGIAAQTLFLAIADLLHRRANLEHSAAEPANLFQAVLLIILLSLPLCAVAGPDVSYLGVHPVSIVLFLAYIAGVRLAGDVKEQPMWRPVRTTDTRRDTPEDPDEADRPVRGVALRFVGLVAVMGAGGLVIAQAGGQFIDRFGLSSSLVGSLITAVVTSLPEFVTTLVAVRRGALQLAVGGIIGGNTFDTLFLVAGDAAYREGSIYHAIEANDIYWLGTGLLMTAVLLAGLILRQREGPARIGIESVLMMGIYLTALTVEVTS